MQLHELRVVCRQTLIQLFHNRMPGCTVKFRIMGYTYYWVFSSACTKNHPVTVQARPCSRNSQRRSIEGQMVAAVSVLVQQRMYCLINSKMRDEPRPKQELYYSVTRVLLTSVWHKSGGLAQLFAVIVLVLAVQLLTSTHFLVW